MEKPMRRFATAATSVVLAATLAGSVLAGCADDSVTTQAQGVRVLAEPDIPERTDGEGLDGSMAPVVSETVVSSLEEFVVQSASGILGSENTGDNVIYAPTSLYYALSLAAAGAQGDTRSELYDFLHTQDSDQARAACRDLALALHANELCEMSMANSVWIAAHAPFEKGYLDIVREDYLASAYEADFGTKEVDAAISSWIADKTGGLLAPQVETDADWLSALVNAMHFKGSWAVPFDADKTSEDVFHAAAGDTQASFMERSAESGFLDGEGFIRAGLYFNGGAQMLFVLPDEGISPSDILADGTVLASALFDDNNADAEITYRIPKFSFDVELQLVETLRSMGLELPFSDKADFSAMTSVPAYLSSIKHGSCVSIDEEGAEAAAYTMAGVSVMSMPMPPDSHLDFVCDRPFLFAIVSPEGAPLFVGVVEDPAK
ncbi:MAG: serpin family protein [Slackia sp.]|nr:serpin family protein [Slackia sp.]